jgi:Gpi18-like mannosyltransferase
MGESPVAERIQRGRAEWGLPLPAVCVAAAIVAASRVALLPYVSEDSTYFLLPWMQEFRDHGAAALGGGFSNYNFPYLFLMFLASLLPVEPLLAIKVASLVGDCLLAFAVGALVAQFRPARLTPRLAGLVALFLPTVLLNASMWGQCDAIYTAFLLLSLRSLLRDDGRGAWLFWAVALSFKLQSVFFLPALALVSLRNRYSLIFPVLAASVWAVLSLPPVLYGRSAGSALAVYVEQTQGDRLLSGAANVFAWFPDATATEGRWWGTFLCAVVVAFIGLAYWRGKDTAERRVLFAISTVAACPLLLPQMHDRYFFAAEVMSLLLLRASNLRFIPWLLSGTGLTVYLLYFAGNQYALPLMIASVVQALGVSLLLRELVKRTDPWRGRLVNVNP